MRRIKFLILGIGFIVGLHGTPAFSQSEAGGSAEPVRQWSDADLAAWFWEKVHGNILFQIDPGTPLNDIQSQVLSGTTSAPDRVTWINLVTGYLSLVERVIGRPPDVSKFPKTRAAMAKFIEHPAGFIILKVILMGDRVSVPTEARLPVVRSLALIGNHEGVHQLFAKYVAGQAHPDVIREIANVWRQAGRADLIRAMCLQYANGYIHKVEHKATTAEDFSRRMAGVGGPEASEALLMALIETVPTKSPTTSGTHASDDQLKASNVLLDALSTNPPSYDLAKKALAKWDAVVDRVRSSLSVPDREKLDSSLFDSVTERLNGFISGDSQSVTFEDLKHAYERANGVDGRKAALNSMVTLPQKEREKVEDFLMQVLGDQAKFTSFSEEVIGLFEKLRPQKTSTWMYLSSLALTRSGSYVGQVEAIKVLAAHMDHPESQRVFAVLLADPSCCGQNVVDLISEKAVHESTVKGSKSPFLTMWVRLLSIPTGRVSARAFEKGQTIRFKNSAYYDELKTAMRLGLANTLEKVEFENGLKIATLEYDFKAPSLEGTAPRHVKSLREAQVEYRYAFLALVEFAINGDITPWRASIADDRRLFRR